MMLLEITDAAAGSWKGFWGGVVGFFAVNPFWKE